MTRAQLIAVWSLSCGAFAVLAWLVRRGATERLDRSVEQRVDAVAHPRLEHLADLLTQVGMVEVTLAAVLVLGLAAILFGRYRLAMAVSLLWLSVPIELAFKWLLFVPRADIPRPSLMPELLAVLRHVPIADLAEPPGSFPSGHVARMTFLLGLVVFLVLSSGRSSAARLAAVPIGAVALGAVIASGYTRVMIGHHTAADVIGGYLLAFALLSLALLLLGWRSHPGPPDRRRLGVP